MSSAAKVLVAANELDLQINLNNRIGQARANDLIDEVFKKQIITALLLMQKERKYPPSWLMGYC